MTWIEVVDASGRIIARRSAEGVPCTIGSAYDNNLFVDGPDVAPYHARIDREADGGLTVTVLGQSSGLHRPGAPERAMSLALSASAPVAMAGGVIRLVADVSGDISLPATATEPTSSGWRAIIARAPVQWGSAALLAVCGAAIGYFTMPGSDRAISAAAVALALLVAECAWVAVWAIAGRIRHGRARFGQHFVVATAIAVIGWGVGEMESWQKFLLPGATAIALALTVLMSLVWVLAVLAHLQVMNPASWNKHLRIAVGFGVALFAIVLGAREYQGQWGSNVEFSSVLKPLRATLVPAKNQEQFSTSLKSLQDALDDDGDEETAPSE